LTCHFAGEITGVDFLSLYVPPALAIFRFIPVRVARLLSQKDAAKHVVIRFLRILFRRIHTLIWSDSVNELEPFGLIEAETIEPENP
jgi:hypothetical protein